MELVIKEPVNNPGNSDPVLYTSPLWKHNKKIRSLKFLKKIDLASSGGMLTQTDLPFAESKMLFLLRGISQMQGNYVTHLCGTNYPLYLKSDSCMGKVQMWKSDFQNAYRQSVPINF